MLPTVDFLKDQANRLIAYMGDKHRFRLKAASAYEAVAPQWREHDWNTLCARAAAVTPTESRVGSSQLAEPHHYALDWGQYGGEFSVPRNDWQRHVLTQGGDAVERRDWLQRQFVAQLERDSLGVYINLFGGQIPTGFLQVTQDQPIRILDLGGELGGECNLLAGLPAVQAAAVLMGALPRFSDPFWRKLVSSSLSTVIEVLLATGANITLARIAREFGSLAYDCGESLLAACPDVPVLTPMQGLRDLLGPKGSVTNAYRALFQNVSEDFERWLKQPGLRRLFAEEMTAPSLLDLMTGRESLLIEMDAQESDALVNLQGALLIGVACAAVARSHEVPRAQRETHSRVLALAEAQKYLPPSFVRIPEQGRSAGWTVLMTVPDETLLKRRFIEDVLGNIWNRLYLGGLPDGAVSGLASRLTVAESVVVSPGRIQYRERLWHNEGSPAE